MASDSAKYLWDAVTAAERAQRFIQGRTFADYQQDEMLRSAVERQLEIVGEALAQLRRIDPACASNIAELPQAVGLKNVLIHGYATVDDRLVWGVAEAHLESLLRDLRRGLSSL
jgi:uncharacterized protein with HEPN domain